MKRRLRERRLAWVNAWVNVGRPAAKGLVFKAGVPWPAFRPRRAEEALKKGDSFRWEPSMAEGDGDGRCM